MTDIVPIGEAPMRRLAERILEAAGSEPDEAAVVADHLVRSNLAGHDSHGVGMLPSYVRFVGDGRLQPNAQPTRLRDDGPFLVFDGQRGYGQRIGRELIDEGIERCRATGIVVLALRGVHHLGRIGTYGEQTIDTGLVSLHFVNSIDHPPLVAPYRGSDARFSTNPVCLAMPGTARTEPILLDMATSKIALGKARVALNKGEQAPPESLIDSSGRPTRDPGVMFREPLGALLPIGAYKGYGLALFCDLFAGILAGGGTMHPGHPRRGAIVNNMLSLILDPNRLGESSWISNEVDALVDWVKGSPPANPEEPVLVAGDPERITAAERLRNGLPVDRTTLEQILEAGEAAGLSRQEAEGLLQR